MKYFLWFLAFVFLCIAAVTGLGVGIGALHVSWICVTITSAVMVLSMAEIAENHFKD